MTNTDPSKLAEEGKQAFSRKQFDQAADLFRRAADGFTLGRAGLLAAEMQNNLSVSLLQAGKPEEALTAALGTDLVFAGANDINRQAMALGNQAAALEALKRYDEAIASYERSAELFAEAGEGDMRAMVMKSAASLKLKTGKITDSALKMMGALEAKQKPNLLERILRFFMRMKS
ncbi:MAG: tetratricopeptide repeat protein [Chloroflexi bacterium]|nr:tetratricopeptide repeat protein [Chloroflexota bacterium]